MKLIFILFVPLLFFCTNTLAQKTSKEQQLRLSLRMIGHQILLNYGDSTSRVYPIEKVGDQYKISFSNKFSFNGEELINTVDEIFRASEITSAYLVEIKDSIGDQIIYSYQKGETSNNDLIACQSRDQPRANFTIFITMINFDEKTNTDLFAQKEPFYSSPIIILVILLTLFMGFLFYKNRKRKKNISTKHLITIGDYNFNPLNAELILNNRPVELTSKESDLLILLNDNLNETVQRDVILEKVWGDQGDYVGRTLDVFISKLRKRLENDDRIKIINARGVGYKLVVNQ